MGATLRCAFGACCVLATFILVGCGKEPPIVQQSETENLSRVLQAYAEAAGTLGRPPRNMGELRPYLEKQGDPEKFLSSPRDGKPYEIRWGVSMRGFSPDVKLPAILAYEQDGLHGERVVLTVSGAMLMTDAVFERAKKARVVEAGAAPPLPPAK